MPTATPDEALVDLLARMHGCSDGRALVFDGTRLVGIVSPSAVARAVETSAPVPLSAKGTR